MPITFSNLGSAHKVQGIFHSALAPAKLTVGSMTHHAEVFGFILPTNPPGLSYSRQ